MSQRFAHFAPALLALAAIAVYANSLGNPFVFDDQGAIVENRHLRNLWPLSEALSAPPQATVAGRPLVSLSLALNHAAGGLDVYGYHAVNLALHVACGLLLFAVVRRSLRSPGVAPSLAARAQGLASATALLWLLHPLGSETINYVVQRSESTMALCYLLTLWAAARALGSERWRSWTALAIAASAAGMASKESMVTAPVAVVLYDLVFRTAPWRAVLARRAPLYIGLAATWLLLGALMWSGPRSATVGFDVGISAVDYARNQCVIVFEYLRTAVWPHPLVFDYGDARPLAPGVAAPYALLLLPLVAASGLALWRRSRVGFPAVWLWLTLAPTSSVVPIASEVGAERRMYLPLAGLVVLAVIGGAWAIEAVGGSLAVRRAAVALLAIVALALGTVTVRRNADYRTNEAIWRSAVSARPDNPRAHSNLGHAVHLSGRPAEALEHYRRALELDPLYGQGQFNLGVALADLGHRDQAVECYRRALELNPALDRAHHNLGSELANRGRLAEAIEHFREAVRLAPESADSRQGLGRALRLSGAVRPALEQLAEAIRLDPLRADSLGDMAWILATHPDPAVREPERAVELARRAVERTGGRHAISLDTLAAAFAAAGRFEEARATSRRARGVALANGADALAGEIGERLGLFERDEPYLDRGLPR